MLLGKKITPSFALNIDKTSVFNPFHATCLFLYPLKTSENLGVNYKENRQF